MDADGGPYRVGDLIAGKYQVLRVIEGGFALVYVVSDGSQQLILKTTKTKTASSANAFRAEASAWIRIGRHPNIVQAFWTDEIAGRVFVAAEFIEPDALGRTTLRDYMVGTPRSLQEIVRWSAEFCHGMDHAINRGIRAHRDVKPENLLIGSRQELQIADFGIASAYAATDSGIRPEISGTPPYMAPEQWTRGDQSVRTDLYAFGVVLHELCLGRLPWRATNIVEIAEAHLHQKVRLPQHPLAHIIQFCLAKSPEQRPSNPRALLSKIADAAKQHNLALPPIPRVRNQRQEELFALSSLGAVGDLKTALAAAQELTRLWPEFAPGWTQLGRIYLESSDLSNAKRSTEHSLHIDPTRSAPWNNLGLILNKFGEYAASAEAFRRAIDADPDNTGAMGNAAESLRMLGRHGEAIQLLARATELAPDKYNLWTNLGGTLSVIQANKEAAHALSRALELAPLERKAEIGALLQEVQSRPKRLKGSALLGQGRYSEAIPLLRAETNAEPSNAAIAQNYAIALLQEGDLDQARIAFQKVHTLEPHNEFAWMQLMQIASKQKNLDEALHWCDKYSAIPGMLARSKASRAHVLDECGYLQKARGLLLDAMKEHPEEPDLYIAYGDIAVKHGVPEHAVSAYRSAIQRMTAQAYEIDRLHDTEEKLMQAVAAADRRT